MGDRYWLWLGVRLLVAAAIVGWAASYLGTGSGEKEFQKTLDAMKHVHSFRVVYSGTPFATQHSEMSWEVDCLHNQLHHHWHLVDTKTNPTTDMTQDETYVNGWEYTHQLDGSWQTYPNQRGSASGYCTALAQGTDTGLLPQIATMIRRGVIQKGDKKTVNGVRCREWLVTMKGGFSGLEHDTLCLGLADDLPYELTVDWEHSRALFSDYNAPIKIDVPEAAVKAASATSESN